MQRKYIDLAGKRFGRWLVIERTPNVRPGMTMWKCQCDCGKIKDHVMYASLVRGHSNSCGCLRSDMLMKPDHKSHSQRNTTYCIWQSMKTRCYNVNHPSYKNHGARGITICDYWLASYDNFLTDMGPRPGKLTLDRIDNDLSYYKENCRWGTSCQQAGNTRRNVHVIWNCKECNVIDVARGENVDYHLLLRAVKAGKKIEIAVSALKAKGQVFHERAASMGGNQEPKTSRRRRLNKPENLPKIDKRYKHFAAEKGEPVREVPNYMIPDPDYGISKRAAPKKRTGFAGKFNPNSAENKKRWKAHAWCKEKGIVYHGKLPGDWDWSIHSR